jgi:hypothetical protein
MARAGLLSLGLLGAGGGGVIGEVFALIEGAYIRAPMLWLALSALLILPAVALISLVTRVGRRLVSRETALLRAYRRAPAGDTIEDVPETPVPPIPRSQAWLTVEGRPGGPLALAGNVIRIGRHGDNDIRLADWSVHRHHAVIERMPDEAFVIADVSGKDGSGVRINGERKERAQLADGDVIELGRSRLRFENAPV